MSRTSQTAERTGFTLVEVVIAILLLTVALLAIEGSAAVTLRGLADAARETSATRFAERQRERTFGSLCAAAAGTDTANGVRAVWAASLSASGARVTQHTAFATGLGVRAESYDAAGGCQ